MLMTITFAIAFLVALNFILLFTSCNKLPKHQTSTKPPYVIKNNKSLVITKKYASEHLAATGS